jgi:transcription elongation factor B subunit 1
MEEEGEKNEGRRLEEGEKMLYKSGTVKLVSAEGFEFIIDRKAAIVSDTPRNMLSLVCASFLFNFHLCVFL